MKWSEHLFCAQRSCHIPKSGSASNMLSFVLSMLGNVYESSLNVKVFFLFLPVSLPLGHYYHFVTTTCLLYVNEFAFTKFPWLYIWSLSNGEWQRYLHSHNQLDLNSICVWRYVALPALVLLFLGCTSIFVGQLPLLIIHVICIYHCKKRRRTTIHFAVCAWTG